MHKLTDHLSAWIGILDHYATEAQTYGPIGLSALGLVTGLLHGATAMLVHSPITVTTQTAPPTVK